ncbi:MAG: tRNA (adenosine(37)-N6)-threonylcarbamoyltransferase complex dimerization subunit type 1 TsaB [Deltaproteobacteria bacterium]|nr:tRNA (adenosine(37)-N6)-threonylcarbamoyltransferase complex dimerization subunit type 1 TsaB [Deltaproteobacteria bacterium]
MVSKILALDTATRLGSIALTEGLQLCAETRFNTEVTHTERILPALESLLTRIGWDLSDLDGLALTIGPGSFTGLRIGLATFKGFAQVHALPLIGISSLKALAHNGSSSTLPVVSLMDAKRGEVYAAAYTFHEGILDKNIFQEQAIKPELLCKTLRELGSCWLLGDGALHYRELFERELGELALFPPESSMPLQAKWVAGLALPLLEKGEGKDWARLTPNYLRLSDAETKK